MSKINLLTEEIINKIAAGEVIERPASVVKELIENSLDAQATQITIEIKDSGKRLIKITDNGEGMDQEDAHNSIIRHATSKISSVQDLFNINTLGFRGEALASIAAVSQMSIITKKKDLLEGYNLVIEGGQLISSGIIAAEQGTAIEIRNLFFNTPARKKFLKTDQVELKHIVDVVLKYALINYKTAFKLIHDHHELINSPIVQNLRDNIASLYGVKLAKELLEINYSDKEGLIKVQGFIVKPHLARNDRSQQNLFVNKRWVRNEEVTTAIYDAYHSLLFVNKHPVFILNIEVNPEEIDVNVHPSKLEIKFEQSKFVQNAVFTAVKETLQKNNLIPILDFQTEQQLSFGIQKKEITKKNEFIEKQQLILPQKEKSETESEKEEEEELSLQKNSTPKNHNQLKVKYGFEPDQQIVLQENESVTFSDQPKIYSAQNNIQNESITNQTDQNNFTVKIPPLKILGQIHKTFFAAETEGGLMIIDQHVVQERVLYEKFMDQYLNHNVAVQNLLKGEILDLSPSEKVLLSNYKKKLASFGFLLEDFGQNNFLLKTVPTIFGRVQPKELFYEVLEKLKEGKNKLEEVQEEIITRMACRASVKAGDSVTIPQMENLLKQLSETKLPYTCPHGRAILIKITADELEKKFKRK